ncbi:AraC family transcriptional regulator [Myroides ceti]|uniref:AraC family transcriptional regulator n=1 Tax=Paenimyroides ceti TaxID=395087 RepID=A0ABT8CZX0_9FLAO|nr:AraC family transcriptional regulator [Paenimyroides ceti]MDN3708519.1 AraC family transcriptional regulator [Paenimyroides ceti]MDN3708861.1 AraC family transcriptional regulator [Paenimyroides ceti]
MKNTSKLLIKGMVCNRCIYVLTDELSKLGLLISEIRLGEVVLKEKAAIDEQMIRNVLQEIGFDILYNKKQQLVEKIKIIVARAISEQMSTGENIKFSLLISRELHKDYDSLSALFSLVHGSTLEKYIISEKLDKVKELLMHTDQSLSEIAYTLGYSSPAHLSNQLKKYTGFTSSYYKQLKQN